MLKFLLLEDSPLDADVTLATLIDGGIDCELWQVDTRDEFVTALEGDRFDLILADYALPGFDGASALNIARSICPDVPFIFVSGSLGEELAIESIKQGATDYVLKQRLERLVTCVYRALREAQGERDRQRMVRAVRESEARFRCFAKNSRDVIWITDAREYRLIYVSPSYEEVWGRSADEIYRDLNNFLDSLHPEDRDRVCTSWQQCNQEVVIQEYRVIRPDGATIWIRDRGFPIRDEAGNLLYIGGIAENITERKQAEAEREQLLERERTAREEAEEANRIKDEFLAIVSHELRSPLNPIVGWTTLLQTQKLDRDRTDRALNIIARNAKLQAELIEDLLDVSRILRGKLSLNLTKVDLARIIQAAIDTVRLAAESKSIQIQTTLEPNISMVSGDSNRLQQVFWNLLSNAIKFTPAEGLIEICLENLGSTARVTVSDTGKGIDPNFLPHIFDYFRQENGATTRQFGGLGLGLAIVYNLVQLHDGTIKADSLGEGQGATFTVELSCTNSFPQPEPNLKSELTEDLSGIEILVVEDNRDTREMITFLLEQYGARAIAVDSARAALNTLTHSQPDILLSDIAMPEIDGYMLLRQVRALPPERGGNIRAIALTAFAGEIDYQQAMSAGFQQHLAKPVEPAKLVKAIISLTMNNE
ncbi:response regulator [Pleurocapsales cyanobacterium LEGE 10410]|nr:response regulator [Pleurocapsales cyanobacterium LEGE 10410]